MADSSADEESVSEYHSASDGGMSDFSVVEDSPFVPRPKEGATERKRKAARNVSGG